MAIAERALNLETKPSRYPLARHRGSIAILRGMKLFSKVDLTKA